MPLAECRKLIRLAFLLLNAQKSFSYVKLTWLLMKMKVIDKKLRS